MPLEITSAAAEVLERAYDAARRFNPEAKVRIYRIGDRIDIGFADRPEDGDEVVELSDLKLFVERGITGTLDVTAEHDRLVMR